MPVTYNFLSYSFDGWSVGLNLEQLFILAVKTAVNKSAISEFEETKQTSISLMLVPEGYTHFPVNKGGREYQC